MGNWDWGLPEEQHLRSGGVAVPAGGLERWLGDGMFTEWVLTNTARLLTTHIKNCRTRVWD